MEEIKEAPKDVKVEGPKMLERKGSNSSSSRDDSQNSKLAGHVM